MRDARVLILTSGDENSASAQRARLLLGDLACPTLVRHRSRHKLRSLYRFIRTGIAERATLVYVVDTVWASVIAALVLKALIRCRFVLDTGDVTYALCRSVGRTNLLGSFAVWVVEKAALRGANEIVVRGSYHREYLMDRGFKNVVEIPDCVSLDSVSDPSIDSEARELRRSLGLEDVLTVGLVGSSVWSPRLGVTYGWDLVEAMPYLDDVAIRGVIIGDGDGVPHLRRRIAELGLTKRFMLIGRVPLESVNKYVRMIDICLSTQTNDLVGWVRTTGKLPLYLANNRFVLATEVGQASRVLPPQMRLPYQGVVDRNYPQRLAERLRVIAQDRSILALGSIGQGIVRGHFDAVRLRARLADCLGIALKNASEAERSPVLVGN